MDLNQKDLAGAIGCNRATIIKVEKGATGDRIIERIADYCKVGKEWLLYGDEEKKRFPVDDELITFLWKHEEIREELYRRMHSEDDVGMRC